MIRGNPLRILGLKLTQIESKCSRGDVRSGQWASFLTLEWSVHGRWGAAAYAIHERCSRFRADWFLALYLHIVESWTRNQAMKIHHLLLAVAAFSFASCASTKSTSSSASAEGIHLFDGETLDGWRKVGGTGEYKVEDGCIVGFGENVQGNTFLRTDAVYGDFELTYEFRFDDRAGNSGLMFRAAQKPSDDGNGRVFGYQCEGDNGHERSWTAGLYDEGRRGWLFPRKGNEEGEALRSRFTSQGQKLFRWDDWNMIMIRCEGNHIKTWLNGELRVNFVDEDPEHDTREGFIGLQVHGGKKCAVRWRGLTLREL